MSMTKAKEKVALVTSKIDENRFSRIELHPKQVTFEGQYGADIGKILQNQFGVKKEDVKVLDDMTIYVGITIDEILCTFKFS